MDPHAASVDVAYSTATDLLTELQQGTLTSVELVDLLLERVRSIDAPGTTISLRSIVAVADDAHAQARACDAERAAGTSRGALHGLPVLVKDNIEVVGLPAAAGSLALRGSQVRSDAPVVARLREAGAIVFGATNCSEWANIRSSGSSSGWSALGGLTANPWALDRSAGGSSSGSGAAVAAGLAPLAIGTETDGSIVCPASVNGVVGLKPTVGALSTEGIIPISHSQDTPGPMARSVADVRLLWEVLHGATVPTVDVRGLRIAVVPQWRTGHKATDECFDAVIERLRAAALFASIGSRDVPEMSGDVHEAELLTLLGELHEDLATYLTTRRPDAAVRSLADVVAFNRAHADEELALFGQELFEKALEIGTDMQAVREAQARAHTWARSTCLDPALAEFDLLLAPTYAPAWKHDFVLGHPDAGGRVTSPAAVAGYPLLSLPMGLVHGLPVGLTIVGGPHQEGRMLAAAEAIEQLVGGTWRPSFREQARG